MIQVQKKHNENKNIYLVGGIIALSLVFMLASVVMVTSKVASGSSAQMLKERLAKQEKERLKKEAKELKIAQTRACREDGKC
ncbi:MAG: hypothetical protein JXQ76_02865 [Campylobacterales bacterium]|nr:hypothetical protein [Campylobacterales bacterium]